MISIAIPVYEMKGFGVKYLDMSLNKILCQTYKNIEVVVSDHSINEDIKHLCELYSSKLNISYIKNEEKRGNSSANLNNALKNCKGRLIKILMQDEFLYDSNAIKKINEEFNKNEEFNWLITGCAYGNSSFVELGRMIPLYSNDIIKSKNTIGSPSVLTIKNGDLLFFNENLLWVMDIDYYKRLYNKYGYPIILNEHLVYILQHKNQMTNYISIEKKQKEEMYMLQTYKIN